MSTRDLKQKPLIEAILEVRWTLTGPNPDLQSDPNYTLLVGRFFDQVRGDYPVYEQLPTAAVPDEMVPYLAQHRFRASHDGWPLAQLGPGVVTVNATDSYTWTDFRERCIRAFVALFNAYPGAERPRITSASLRYIDAVEFDYRKDSLFKFLAENMNASLSLPAALFSRSTIDAKPSVLNWQCSFACSEPPGTVGLRFLTGQKEGTPALIWETHVGSSEAAAPLEPGAFAGWLDASHEITDEWFFKLIEGELERKFSGT